MTSVLKLSMSSDPRYLGVVRSAIERYASLIGFGEEDCRWITLALHEALTNVIRHAYHGKEDQPIEISFGESQGGIEILLVDHGDGVRPEQLSGRPLDEVRPGGLGTHMIREIMDNVHYAPLADRNELRLWKALPANPAKGE
jgi:anti-sigma regulatory factor (Ser/Thr protein kinase)